MDAPSTPASQVLDETDPSKQEEFSPEDDRLFLSLENYCWEDDPEFQSGLTQILSTTTDPVQVRHLTRQAKCFFYSRKISRPISFPIYSAWLDREENSAPRCRSPSCEVGPPLDPTPIESGSKSNPSIPSDTPTDSTAGDPNGDDKTPYPTSFAQIVELITSGKPIPGIREIPNTLNAAPPTQNSAQQRRKPWEVVATPEGGVDSLPSPAPTPES
ncbi:hypothetical protein AOL_s00215g216 [Orbilia oligospora ATCC 24927]|uniref:Uncharacterized protein n=2 Tax=Orbilia oligospora TaxID=2813651 RepID=G1XTT7_ARTOA|nr:hypothetical protein AOL_s00215g216 [Orbilia oligospora ATCC 24927]EGX43480.1 hypothetical protein AOL_s00215g216 [Orbilia oligospora ATCC 24927]KAF3280169.1 hypothetical protein TWF970_002923 [Orbilia oligospora]